MKNVSVISWKSIPSDTSAGTAAKDKINETALGEPIIEPSDGEKPVTLERLFHVFYVEQSSISVSKFCDDDHSVKSTNLKCVLKKNYVVGVGRRVGALCSVNPQGASDKTFFYSSRY